MADGSSHSFILPLSLQIRRNPFLRLNCHEVNFVISSQHYFFVYEKKRWCYFEVMSDSFQYFDNLVGIFKKRRFS